MCFNQYFSKLLKEQQQQEHAALTLKFYFSYFGYILLIYTFSTLVDIIGVIAVLETLFLFLFLCIFGTFVLVSNVSYYGLLFHKKS